MIVKWHDRKNVKAHFADWKNSNDPFLLMHVPDTQEIRDICGWIERHAGPFLPVTTIYSSGRENLKHELLKVLTEELGGEEKFASFYRDRSYAVGFITR